ncbi:hypothetical protein [Phytohabitans houttuyneae]|uniref:DUF998 domain-containing protein n=1 Tax=Phytohabitans houttuyneae TaxID=1076126 RepID=A0A6V8JYU7_9ACTN|nr:hypothetical protein [Phytohabitans houttuyneae]GFJ77932.1 hypothetical protein Phou_021120 [Phytohabitans houttuyneae]
MRLLGAAALAGLSAAAVASAQLWLAGRTRVYYPEQAFHATDASYGNPAWPAQLIVVAWCTTSAVLVGAAVAAPLSRHLRWRHLVTAAAVLGSLAAMRLATGPAARAQAAFDAGAEAARAVVIGAALGGLMALAIQRWPGAGRSAVVWVAWIWCTVAAGVITYEHHRPGTDHIVPVPALTDPGVRLVALAVLLAALLGWWAARRADPHPVIGAVSGPAMLVAVSVALQPLVPDGDHRAVAVTLGSAFLWSLAALCGAALATVAVRIGRERVGSTA